MWSDAVIWESSILPDFIPSGNSHSVNTKIYKSLLAYVTQLDSTELWIICHDISQNDSIVESIGFPQLFALKFWKSSLIKLPNNKTPHSVLNVGKTSDPNPHAIWWNWADECSDVHAKYNFRTSSIKCCEISFMSWGSQRLYSASTVCNV